jgi:hypothetical protein
MQPIPLTDSIHTDSHPKVYILIPESTSRHTARDDDHPGQEDRADDPERKDGVPALTNAVLLQPRKRLHANPIDRVVDNVVLARIIDIVAGPEQLNSSLDQASDEQDEEAERAEDDDAGEEAALEDEREHDEDEDDGEGADCDAIGDDPARR